MVAAREPNVLEILREELLRHYSAGSHLEDLIGPKHLVRGHDTREHLMEDAAESVVRQALPKARTWVRKRFHDVLRTTTSFPASAIPDLIVQAERECSVCEFKASRTTDPRFDSELQPKSSLAKYLAERGCTTSGVTEVEQDIVKLLAYREACAAVSHGVFIMIDGYGANNSRRSWSQVFSREANWLDAIKTNIVKQAAQLVFSSVSIRPIACGKMRANMISLAV